MTKQVVRKHYRKVKPGQIVKVSRHTRKTRKAITRKPVKSFKKKYEIVYYTDKYGQFVAKRRWRRI